jgi:glutathione S-transferase
MSTLKLSYFDLHGGRGEPARLALACGGIDFEDHRIPRNDWPTFKAQMPFHAIPVLEVDGKVLTQSNTINRYVGKLAGLYPDDPWQAALCDEVMDAVEDVGHKIVATFFMADEEKKAAREALAQGPIPLYLKRLNSFLKERGGEYFADGRLTVADLKVFVWIRQLRSGILDHIPAAIVDQHAPLLVQHFARVNDTPNIRAYYSNR